MAARLRSLPRTRVQALIRAGWVRLDGAPVRRPSQRIQGERRLVLSIPPADPTEAPLELESTRILHCDAELLVVDKPAGYPVSARLARAGEDLLRAARRLLGPETYLTPPHRLDRATSGVLLLARTRSLAAALGEAFRAGRVRKRYAAVVATRPPAARGVVDLPVLAPGDGSLPRIDPAGRPARTRYRLLGRGPAGWCLLLTPRTGRTHQLRLHLAALGCPILGDTVHGGPPAARLHLHARSLSVPHPQGRRLRFRAPLPFPWCGGAVEAS